MKKPYVLVVISGEPGKQTFRATFAELTTVQAKAARKKIKDRCLTEVVEAGQWTELIPAEFSTSNNPIDDLLNATTPLGP